MDTVTVVDIPQMAVGVFLFIALCYILTAIVDKVSAELGELVSSYIIIIPVALYIEACGFNIFTGIIIGFILAWLYLTYLESKKGER